MPRCEADDEARRTRHRRHSVAGISSPPGSAAATLPSLPAPPARSPRSSSPSCCTQYAGFARVALPAARRARSSCPPSGPPTVTARSQEAQRPADSWWSTKCSASGSRWPARARSTGRATSPPSRCSACSISGSRRPCASWKRCPADSGIMLDDVMAGVYAALVLFASRMVQSLLNMPLRKSADPKPQISQVTPPAAIPGGELQIRGKGFAQDGTPQRHHRRSRRAGRHRLRFLRDRARAGRRHRRRTGGRQRHAIQRILDLRHRHADRRSLHPVANPAVDSFGNIYTTFSGSRGQKVPVAVYKIDLNFTMKPFINDLMNATALAFDQRGHAVHLQPLRRHGLPGHAQRQHVASTSKAWAWPPGSPSIAKSNLYVGDRSGTIFKISPTRQIFVFATLEPSISAYHLAFGPDGYLYVTGPTTSSFDAVYRISHEGEVEMFYRGLGRPQGMAFDEEGRLYVAASIAGRKGVVRINPDRARRAVPLRPRHRRPGVHAVARHDRGHHQRPLSRGCRHQRAAALTR